MDNQEKNNSVKNFEITINGKSIINKDANLNQEELVKLSESLRNNLQNVMNTLNESLITKVEKLHADLIRFQNTDHTGWLNDLPSLDFTNLVNSLPVFEISKSDGKFNFKLNNDSLFELDLNQLQNQTTKNQRMTSDNG
ncbi:MAG: hypothetical protein ACO1OT_00905 [Heyndrickxia sp.]